MSPENQAGQSGCHPLARGASVAAVAISKRVLDAARYVARRQPGLPKMSLVKLLFLADWEYARRHGKTLTGESWWREQRGPLSTNVTGALETAAFALVKGTSPSGNPRIAVTEVGTEPLETLGTAEISVLELTLAEHGKKRQVELLEHVYAIPAVKKAPLKSPIGMPEVSQAKTISGYVNELLEEIAAEDRVGLYEWEGPSVRPLDPEMAALASATIQ